MNQSDANRDKGRDIIGKDAASQAKAGQASSGKASAGKASAGDRAFDDSPHDLSNWPNRHCSSFVHAAGIDWHVQISGRGPLLLLVHGAGGATHSWRDLLPLLAKHFTVLAVDLPGHGFTDAVGSHQASLPGMAQALGKLLRVLQLEPEFALGHSAGAAILVRMCLDGVIAPRALMCVNGAFKPFGGLAGQIFSPLAKILALNPFVPRIFAWSATDPNSVQRLIKDTGSSIDRAGMEQYAALFRKPAHVAGALKMMANWDLSTLAADMTKLRTPLILVVGVNDRTVSPSESEKIARKVAGAKLIRMPKLGHLAHEEDPQAIARLAIDMATQSQD